MPRNSKVPVERFICTVEGELDYIKLRVKSRMLKQINSFPDTKEYLKRFGEPGLVMFKITKEDGHMSVNDPKVEHSQLHPESDEWSDERIETWQDRIEVLTGVNNWKDKILSYIDPSLPERYGLVNTGCFDPSTLLIDRPDELLTEAEKDRIEWYDIQNDN